MAILHLIETGGAGGAEQMLLRLAEEYLRRGLRQVVCLRKDGWLAAEVRRRGLPLAILPLGRLPDLGWLLRMRRLAAREGIAAIHSHEFAMNVRAALLARSLDIPAVATVHGKNYYADSRARRLAYRVSSVLARLVAVSSDIGRHLTEVVGVDPARITVIPNGIDMERFRRDLRKRLEVRGHFGVGDDELLLGTVGSYYDVKGHRFLIEALHRLCAVHGNLRLVMAGRGPLADRLTRLAEERGLQGRVQLAGYIEDTPGFLSALDIFVMPSLSEGHPLALLEAAATGCCIAASDVGGIPEIVANGDSALLVPPGDVDALVAALASLLADPALRRSLAAKAAAVVQQRWTIQRAADQYLALLLPR